MKLKYLATVVIVVGMILGCGSDQSAEEVRNLRRGGQLLDARNLALQLLEEKASRQAVWLEFIRASVELSRQTNSDAEAARPYIIQGGLAFGVFYEFKEHKLNAEWLEVGQLLSGETIRQINILSKALQKEAGVARHYQQLSEFNQNETDVLDAMVADAERISEFRAGAGFHIEDAVIFRFLLERQPETNPGMRKTMLQQLDATLEEWESTLELSAAYVSQVNEQSARNITTAFTRAQGDLSELGYLLPQSILENEVLE
ncbi:MAG: hypothetical protein ACOZB3_10115 [Calditrichota bacterium]